MNQDKIAQRTQQLAAASVAESLVPRTSMFYTALLGEVELRGIRRRANAKNAW